MPTVRSEDHPPRPLGEMVAAVLAIIRWDPSRSPIDLRVSAVRAARYDLFHEEIERLRLPALFTVQLAAGESLGFDAGPAAIAGSSRFALLPAQHAWYCDQGVRSAATVEAQRHLLRIASRLARSTSVGRRDSAFAEHLCQQFWQRLLSADLQGKVDASDAVRLGGFCYTTLYRIFVDDCRRARVLQISQPTGEQEFDGIPGPPPMGPFERFLTAGNPLPEADLAVIRTWPHRDRLMLLSWIGLWRRVPRDEWNSWAATLSYPLPFPPEAFLRAQEQERLTELAKALGMTYAAVVKDLARKLPRLRDLPSLREILPEKDRDATN